MSLTIHATLVERASVSHVQRLPPREI
jgi:hypothetical protein